MISEQDKQAILNGAYAVTRAGKKVKYLGCNNENLDKYPWKFIQFDDKGQIENRFLNLAFVDNNGFQASALDDTQDDVMGLWEDKPEPFNLEQALKGECINYNGEPCYIYYSNRKTETHEYIVEASSGAFTLGGVCEDELSKCMMWKEPKPLFSTNSLQLPKPITNFKDNDAIVYMLSAVAFTGKFKVAEVKTFNRDESMLVNGRYYNSRQDVIQIIEAITGKPYEDR
ncbi:hypothetical protein ACIX56_02310 [Actinobacillus pleuropneumoniae]|uniref:hypothetical protein n=1 Tax=Actinobacillus pleuropneumoniae TaxID=715 RepID=UPI0002F2B7D2|nr:hypothetical protein [Actinobacillus pleuropneumoniae]UKH38570.1 hypothetical protein D1100_02285 [Actinobacillus pleuropneumoniae]